MNALQGVLIAATVIVAGAGPFIAVHIGGKAFEGDQDEPDECDDRTTQIPRVTDEVGPYMY